MNIKGNFRSPCEIINDVITMTNTYHGIIWDDLIISDLKLKLCLFFYIFTMAILGRDNLFTGSDTISWMYQQDSHGHLRHFEYLTDAIAQILMEIWLLKVLVYFGTWWRHQWCHEYEYIYQHSHNPMIHMYSKFNDDIFVRFYPRPVLASGYCRCLHLCVSLCANHLFVRMITQDPFKLG